MVSFAQAILALNAVITLFIGIGVIDRWIERHCGAKASWVYILLIATLVCIAWWPA